MQIILITMSHLEYSLVHVKFNLHCSEHRLFLSGSCHVSHTSAKECKYVTTPLILNVPNTCCLYQVPSSLSRTQTVSNFKQLKWKLSCQSNRCSHSAKGRKQYLVTMPLILNLTCQYQALVTLYQSVYLPKQVQPSLFKAQTASNFKQFKWQLKTC